VTVAAEVDQRGPGSASAAFCNAINRGDLEAACACFAREGFLVTPDATAVRGRGAIRGVLAQLIEAGVKFSIEDSGVLIAGTVAIAHDAWRIRSRAPGGSSLARDSRPTLVLQQIESRWKFALAAPWGWGG
jgi:ketosteroid isomerase-like protein